MREKRKYELVARRILKFRNARGTSRLRLQRGAMAIALLAVGIIGFAAAMPAASADPAQLRDDNNGRCPGGWVADYWPGGSPDLNGNSVICYRAK